MLLEVKELSSGLYQIDYQSILETLVQIPVVFSLILFIYGVSAAIFSDGGASVIFLGLFLIFFFFYISTYVDYFYYFDTKQAKVYHYKKIFFYEKTNEFMNFSDIKFLVVDGQFNTARYHDYWLYRILCFRVDGKFVYLGNWVDDRKALTRIAENLGKVLDLPLRAIPPERSIKGEDETGNLVFFTDYQLRQKERKDSFVYIILPLIILALTILIIAIYFPELSERAFFK